MLEQLVEYLKNKGERAAATVLLEALTKHARTYEEYDDLAKCYFKVLKDYKRAIPCCLDALTSAVETDKMWAARSNLINIYNHANYPELAMVYIKQNEQVLPDDLDTKLEKAFSHFLLNQKDDAEKILLDTLLIPNLPDEIRTKILFNLGTYCLWRDEFKKGLNLFLLEGNKLNYWQKATLPYTFWEGIIQPGRTIILFAEAGIGDEIINVRFMKHLTEYGMNPVWLSNRKDLVNIFNRNGFNAICNINELKDKNNLLWTYPMRLPTYLNLEYKDLWYGPYLTASDESIEKFKWISDVGNWGDKPLKIGIRWQGNPDYDQDLHRSVPLKEIYTILKDFKAEYYSLQRDTGLEELSDFPNIIPLHDVMESFDDTLGIIHNLDMVITSCTSIAHASAAMGKSTFVLTPISAYYTWSHSTEKSPWYGDNVTLLRQVTPRCWDEPLEQLRLLIKM